MNLQSRLILLLIGGYCLWVIHKKLIKKEGGCADCPSCSSCSGCKSSSSCKFEEGQGRKSTPLYK